MTKITILPESLHDQAEITSKATGIITALEMRLKGKDSVIAMGILDSIETKMPALKIIAEIKQMIQDNEPLMTKVLGWRLLTRLKFFYHV